MQMKSVRGIETGGNGVLNGLSRVLNIDVEYFVHGGFWLGVDQGVGMLLRLVQVAVFAHVVDKTFYGEYQFIITMMTAFALFALPAMDTAIIQSVANGYKSSLVVGTRAKFKWSLLGCLGLVLTGLFYKFVRPEPFWLVLILCAVFFPFYFSLSSVSAYYRGRENFRAAAVYGLLVEAVAMVVVVGMLMLTKSLVWVVGSMMASSVLVLLWVFVKARREIRMEPVDKNVVSFGIHLTVMNALNYLSFYADKLIIGILIGLENLAVYSVAIGAANNLAAGGNLFGILLLPKLSRNDHSAKIKQWFWLAIIGSLAAAVAAAFVMPWLIPLLFSEKYSDAVLYSQIVMAFLVFYLPACVLRSYFQGRKKTKFLYVHNVTFGILNLVLLFVFVPLYGILGAVISKVALHAVGLASMLAYFLFTTKVKNQA